MNAMKNGLYIVDSGQIYGAFVVKNGEITNCAPILRRNIGYYKQIARFVPTEGEEVEPEEMYPPPCPLYE